jgi:hypothetical protein
MTVPEINVARADAPTMSKNLDAAFNNLSATGNPIAPAYTASTWGGSSNVEQHHLIPVSVTKDYAAFFDKIREGTFSASGGAFSFDTNDAQNAIYLPSSEESALIGRSGNPPVYAAVHNGGNRVHTAYSDFLRQKLEFIQESFTQEIEQLASQDHGIGTPQYTEAAQRAAAQVTQLQNDTKARLVSNTPDGVKFFLNPNDSLFQAAYGDQPVDAETVRQHFYSASNESFVSDGSRMDRILPDGQMQTVFTTEEDLRNALNGADARDINGIPKDEYIRTRDQLISKEMQANPGLSHADAETKAIGALQNVMDAKTYGQLLDNNLHSGGNKPLTNLFNRGSKAAEEALSVLKDFNDRYPGVGKALGVLGFVAASMDAQEAHAAGRPDEAKAIMAQWASDEAASWVLGLAAGVAAGAGATALGVPALGAAAVGLAAGIAADYAFGSDVSKVMLDSLLQGLGKLGFDLAEVKSALAGNSSVSADALNFSQPPGSINTAAQNPTVLDVSVDTTTLKPDPTNGLGATQNGQGLLQSGTGWQAVMPNEFVNLDGLGHVSGSALVADMTRLGNHSIHDLQAQMNALRSTIYASAQVEAVTNSQFSAVLPGGTASSVAGVSIRLSGGAYGSERTLWDVPLGGRGSEYA